MADLRPFRRRLQSVIDAAEVMASSFNSRERYQYYYEDLRRTSVWVPATLPDGSDFFLQPGNRRLLRNIFYLAAAKIDEPIPENDVKAYLTELGLLCVEMRKLSGKIEFDRRMAY